MNAEETREEISRRENRNPATTDQQVVGRYKHDNSASHTLVADERGMVPPFIPAGWEEWNTQRKTDKGQLR